MRFKSRTVDAGRWAAFSAIGRTTIQFAQIMILARILGPTDFGKMAIISSLLAVLTLLSDIGLNRSLIHFQNISNTTLTTLYWLNISVAGAIFLSIYLLAPLFGNLYGQPDLAPAIALCATVVPIIAIGQQFRVLAEKQLMFRTLAAVEMCSPIVGLVFAALLALNGYGLYALVWASIVSTSLATALYWIFLSKVWTPSFQFNPHGIRKFLRYGIHLVGENIATSLRMQADVLIAGQLATPANVGLYSMTRELSLKLANSMINPVVTRLSLPLMSETKNDAKRLREMYLTMVALVAALNFPIYVAVGLFAEEVVAVLYGSKWTGAVYFLHGFAVWGLIRCVGNPVGSLLHATGKTRRAFYWNLLLLLTVVPLIYAAGKFGELTGLMWMMIATELVIFFMAWRYLVFPSCGASLSEYVLRIAPPLAVSLMAGIPASLTSSFFDVAWIRLVVGCATGGGIYWILSLYLNRGWTQAFLQFFSPLRR